MIAAARTRPIPGRASSSSTILRRAMASSVSAELMTLAMVSSPVLRRSLASALVARAAAAYASGGVAGLERLASRETDARKLLTALGRRS